MKINLVKRGRVVHAGIAARNNGQKYLISVCNGRWCCEDTTSIGESTEVTCKRCLKYVKEAEENNGIVTIKPRR